MTDGVTYEDVIPVLQEMLQSGAEADAADDGHRSDADTHIVTDIASVASQHESFFSLAPADDAPITNVPHGMPFPSMSPDETWYTPSEKFKVTSVLTAVAATSEIPEGDVQLPSCHDLPHRDVISQKSRASAALTSTATDDLPTNVSTLTQGIVDNHDDDGTFPIDVAAPSIVATGSSRVDSNPKRKASSTQDDTKSTKKSRTSERGKKTSRVAGLSKRSKSRSHGGNSRRARSRLEDDDDYVPPGKQSKGKGKSRA
jgi:hypothetical protein